MISADFDKTRGKSENTSLLTKSEIVNPENRLTKFEELSSYGFRFIRAKNLGNITEIIMEKKYLSKKIVKSINIDNLTGEMVIPEMLKSTLLLRPDKIVNTHFESEIFLFILNNLNLIKEVKLNKNVVVIKTKEKTFYEHFFNFETKNVAGKVVIPNISYVCETLERRMLSLQTNNKMCEIM